MTNSILYNLRCLWWSDWKFCDNGYETIHVSDTNIDTQFKYLAKELKNRFGWILHTNTEHIIFNPRWEYESHLVEPKPQLKYTLIVKM